MRRYVMAAALVSVAVGFAQADYVIIRVNLNATGKAGVPVQPGGVNDLGLVALIEYEKAIEAGDNQHVLMRHRWGRSWLDFDEGKGIKGTRIKMPSLHKRFLERFEALKRQVVKVGRAYLEETQWAVSNGLLDEIMQKEQNKALMAAFLAVNAQGDEGVVAAQKACKAVGDKLLLHEKQPVALNPDALALKETLKCNMLIGQHYQLLYDAEGKGNRAPREVHSRLARLEQTFRQFYFWFALRGKELPMPEKKLVALLIDKPRDFEDQSKFYDSPPRLADAFYVPRDNLIVFSATRLDSAFDALDKRSKELLQGGWNFDTLLTGRGGQPRGWPPKGKAQEEANKEYATNQTIALLYRSMAEEAEYAAVTHHATRQLLTASGLLPRGVQLPQWLAFGLPTAFETAKTDPFSQTGAFWPTYGEAHWVYMTYFKLWEQAKPPLLDSPEDALRAVLTDRYFRDAALDPKDPDKLIRARTMAWALAFYLPNRHVDGLLRYAQELDALPRDLDMDPEAQLLCFARAFQLVDPAKPDTILPAKFQAFAADWYREMKTKALPVPKMLQEGENALKERRPTLLGGKAKE